MTTKTKKKAKIRPPFKTNSGKYYLSTWIVDHFPKEYKELHYVEPCVGGGSIILNKEISKEESIGDTDKGIVDILKSLRDDGGHFVGRLKRTKYCKSTFEKSKKRAESKLDHLTFAVNEFILRRMSYGGNKKTFSPDGSSWEKIVYNELPIMAERLQDVYIFQRNAVDVAKAFSNGDTFCFCDPPDLCEENQDDQVALVDALISFRGHAMFCGHSCSLYRNKFTNWRCARKKPSSSKKTEYLWMNY
ncbi:MAG: DNA adenine methylase [Candidatus Thorarchaeota archaeon]|jgi:site-specific DNA-adenine methylase